ncbi:MAG TPA: hypothetical protein VF092_08150 [Longimicrobium sp.]
MRRRSMGRWIAAAVLVAGVAYAFRGPWVEPGHRFTLRRGEKVMVEGSWLSIRLDAVGHHWFTNGSTEEPYATLTVRQGFGSRRELVVGMRGSGEPVGASIVRLVEADPSEYDGGPTATLVISQR